jgi:hypothetical protein
VRIEGGDLTIPNGSTLPPRCVKCGTPHGLAWRDQVFRYLPAWSWALGVLRVTYVVKWSSFRIAVCEPCGRTWKIWTASILLAWIPGICLGLLAAWVAGSEALRVPLVPLGFFGGLVAAYVMANRAGVRAVRIDDTCSRLRGLHPTVIAEMQRADSTARREAVDATAG